MKIYKVFEREEIENALEAAGIASDSFWDCIGDNFCNDVAVPWYVESPYEGMDKAMKVINEFFISQGCAISEGIYIDVTW